jgi:hypothetical protein
LLNAFPLAGAPQPSIGEVAGTSGNAGTLLTPGGELENLQKGPLLPGDSISHLQQVSKEMYELALVRDDYTSGIVFCRAVHPSQSFPLMQDVSRGAEEKSERLKAAEKHVEELTQEQIKLEKANAEL